jgi:hypothetical protein
MSWLPAALLGAHCAALYWLACDIRDRWKTEG